MYTKKIFPPKDMLKWTRQEIGLFTLIAFLEIMLFHFSKGVLFLPFTPVAVLGTAVAFIIAFQTNSAYDRIWEARKIWGAIVNSSRTFGMMVNSFISNEHNLSDPLPQEKIDSEIKNITYRHIAWLTALRYAMREPRDWEYLIESSTTREYMDTLYIPERLIPLEDAIRPYISDADWQYIGNKSNKQTALLYLQSKHLTQLKNEKLIWEFSYLELENVIEELFTHQGKSERIKNFPYPRQFASMLYYITWSFILILPIGMVGQFADMGFKIADRLPGVENWFYWLSLPFSVLVMWIFYTMNRIGRTGENPFEGTPNDVPISTISRGIEIDLRQNLGENPEDIPEQFPAANDTQM